MKKKYIAPESRLFAINLKEGIAAVSGGISEVSGAAVIKFTHAMDGCRGYYTGVQTAEVKTPGTSFLDYYNELMGYGAEAYFACFRYQFSG